MARHKHSFAVFDLRQITKDKGPGTKIQVTYECPSCGRAFNKVQTAEYNVGKTFAFLCGNCGHRSLIIRRAQ